MAGGTPNYPRDMASEFNRLRKDVKNAFTSANLRTGMAKIGAKTIEITGELILNAGAALRAQYVNGVNAFSVAQGYYNSHPISQVAIKRFDGSMVFQVFGGELESGYFSIQDRLGNIIISDDGVTGAGLARPWLPYHWVRTADITSPKDLSTSTTFAAHHTTMGEVQHPKIRITGYVVCNGSDVAEVRLRDPGSGTVIWTSGNVTSGWLVKEGNHPNYNFADDFQYDIEVRRVSGTSTGVGFTPVYIYGRQS